MERREGGRVCLLFEDEGIPRRKDRETRREGGKESAFRQLRRLTD